VHRKSVLRE